MRDLAHFKKITSLNLEQGFWTLSEGRRYCSMASKSNAYSRFYGTDGLWSSLAFAFLEKITIPSTEYLVFTYYFLAQDGNITRYVSTWYRCHRSNSRYRYYSTYVRTYAFIGSIIIICHSFIQIQILKSR